MKEQQQMRLEIERDGQLGGILFGDVVVEGQNCHTMHYTNESLYVGYRGVL